LHQTAARLAKVCEPKGGVLLSRHNEVVAPAGHGCLLDVRQETCRSLAWRGGAGRRPPPI